MQQTTVTERPILFSTDMVLATLSGQKTETRRDKGLEEVNKMSDEVTFCKMGVALGKNTAFFDVKAGGASIGVTCPYGKPGNRLWVRETWSNQVEPGTIGYKANEGIMLIPADSEGLKFDIALRANLPTETQVKWKPSIHMPRSASRILLEITDIRVERLHDISEEDAKAEGVQNLQGSFSAKYRHYCPTKRFTKEELEDGLPFCSDARASFFTLWISIKGEDSLNKNPWVWVVKYKVVEVKK